MIDLKKRRRHKLTDTAIQLAAHLTFTGISEGRAYNYDNWQLQYYPGPNHWALTNSETNMVEIIPNARLAASIWLSHMWGPNWMT